MERSEIYEQDWENCPYAEQSYYEWDTGYREYDCLLWKKKNGKFYGCVGGDIHGGCPLSFRYKVEMSNRYN